MGSFLNISFIIFIAASLSCSKCIPETTLLFNPFLKISS